MKNPLPTPTAPFTRKKSKILAQLSVPATEYADASPKGSVDEGIRHLIDEINGCEGLVTTSSCAGRVSVFLEGQKVSSGAGDAGAVSALGEGGDGEGGEGEECGEVDEEVNGTEGRRPAGKFASSAGGKGGGGTWLFVSHDPVEIGDQDVTGLLGLEEAQGSDGFGGCGGEEEEGREPGRLIHFKFEPMILHILTASPSHAELVLKSGLQAGYRESGAINLLERKLDTESATPIVAIRSMGLSLESLIGMETNGRRRCIVSAEYLRMLVRIANERFAENQRRIERFREALEAALDGRKSVFLEGSRSAKELRRETKRAEGLKRQEELRRQRRPPGEGDEIFLEQDLF